MENSVKSVDTRPGPTVRQVIERAGGLSILARAINTDRRLIHKWKQIPAKRVLDVERVTGISRHELRPDIFGASNG